MFRPINNGGGGGGGKGRGIEDPTSYLTDLTSSTGQLFHVFPWYLS